jgi:hypothetical protein
MFQFTTFIQCSNIPVSNYPFQFHAQSSPAMPCFSFSNKLYLSSSGKWLETCLAWVVLPAASL